MRWLAWLLTPLTLVAAVWAGDQLRLALEDPLPPDRTPAVAPQLESVATRRDEPQPPVQWPSLFGRFAPPEPQPPAPPPPPPTPEIAQPPVPPAPPIESLGYALKGLVSNGDTRWAIVSHPTGDRLLRAGDSLEDGIVVTAIEDGGLAIDNRGNPAFLAFVE